MCTWPDPDLVKTNCNFGTGEDKVTSAWEPRGPSSCAYLQILLDESTGVLLLPPGWDATPLQGDSDQHLIGRYPFVHQDGERH